ncbi:PQQ-binding-like beta-propeller repeat protein [Roseiconus nitratireducens]|uniref:PQQ-binding-like beta-propeller repeat protein n=1 Tax=Roseiconus nitratireducens TaxID=2605748 RepID=A0A5M6DIV4_9BACT|nr:PQQ-binding-like beta-propeller repeat protein [Roseiconus nitratireducens]KAA5546162.1 PQQ-binding-like beta-propeller repeat protein [Roseiconus nitratireducens]
MSPISTRRVLFHVVAFALTVGSVPTAQAEDWTQWRGAHRDNRSPETGLFGQWKAGGPPLVWTAEGLGGGYASVSVVGNRIYTTGNFDDNQSVIAIDATDGSVLWKQPVTSGAPKHGYEGSRSTPTIDQDRLYVVTSDGRIVCLNTADGSERWSRDFDDWNGKMMSVWGFSESPLVDGERVLCTPGGPQALMVCLDKLTGQEIWKASLKSEDTQDDLKAGAGYSSAVISNGGGVKQYVQLVGKGLIGVRADDGQILWRYSRVANTTANIPTPIVDGDFVFTSTAYGTGSALLKLAADGRGGVTANEVYWLDAGELQNKHGGMTLVDGYIYCGHGNGNGLPICVEMATGKTAWGPERAEGKGETSMVYADGHLVMRRQDGTIMLVEATPRGFTLVQSFKPEFQDKESWAHPVIANGRLYLREQAKLMCYDVK